MTELNKIFFKLVDTITKLNNSTRYYKHCGALRSTEVRFLEIIGNQPKVTAKELSEELNISCSTISKQIQNLVEKKYIDRITNEQNRREIYLSLTQLGDNLYKQNNNCKQQLLKAIQRDLINYNSEDYLNIIKIIEKRITKHLKSIT